MTRTRPALTLVLAALVLLGAACGSDGDGDDAADATTTEASGADAADAPASDDPASTDPADDTAATDGPADPATEPDPDVTTTSPNLAPNDSPLGDLLLAPSAVGDGFAPDDVFGDGSFDGDLCEEVIIESTAADEASQALGSEADGASFLQSVMRFADADAASDFVAAVVAGLVECTPGAVVDEIDGVGDQASIISDDDGQIAITASLVRVGDLVSWTAGVTESGGSSPITEDLVGRIGEQLAA